MCGKNVANEKYLTLFFHNDLDFLYRLQQDLMRIVGIRGL